MGITDIIVPAAIQPKLYENWPFRYVSAAASGYFSGSSRMTSGHRKLFQNAITSSSTITAIPGLTSGRTSCQKMRSSEAPSIFPESLISDGMPRKVCRIRKILNTDTAAGSTTPR
ncbi:hypothetical protein D3C87_1885880 [compost metagenome]